MYSNNDPHCWEIRDLEGRVIEKGFSSYAKAAAKIREWSRDAKRIAGVAPRVTGYIVRGVYFPVRSR